MTRLGVIARADDRGLGIQTWEVTRHLDCSPLVVVPAFGERFDQHLDRYPGAPVVSWDGERFDNEDAVRDWLWSVDVVYTAETFYDWRLIRWARDAGVRTILHANPEFFDPRRPRPTVVWLPTPWLSHRLPEARIVRMPVALDRFSWGWHDECAPMWGDRLRVLHVTGRAAWGDRNGALLMRDALERVREPIDVRLAVQLGPTLTPRGGAAVVEHVGAAADYWELYRDVDLLVMPRRFGGLCLPVQEAMAAGAAVMMTDCPPNPWWPVTLVPAHQQRNTLAAPIGEIPLYEADVRSLAAAIDELAVNRVRLAALRRASVRWAKDHSWDRLAGRWRSEIDRAAEMVP